MPNLGGSLFLLDLEDYDGGEKQGDEHERYGVQKLDEDVQAWPSSILPRISNSVSHDCGGVCFCVLAAEVSHFHIFLGVVHCRSAPHHHDREGYRGNRGADNQGSDGCPA